MLLMQLAKEVPDFRPQDPLHRDRLGRDHMHVEVPRAKRRGHLQADEARADHHRAFRRQGLGKQGAAVRQVRR